MYSVTTRVIIMAISTLSIDNIVSTKIISYQNMYQVSLVNYQFYAKNRNLVACYQEHLVTKFSSVTTMEN